MIKALKNDAGFTLVELLVVVAVSAIVMAAMYGALLTGDQQFQTSQVKMNIQDSAREGLYKMIQEIRQTAPGEITISNGGGNIQFSIPDLTNPLDTSTYEVDWDTAETVSYSIGGLNNSQILRNSSASGQTVIANDVTSVTFTGNQANSPTRVTIDMQVQRQITNTRAIPATPLQMTAQAEVRNT